MIRALSTRNRRYSSVFFDLDGTITESGPGVFNAARYMFKRLGHPEQDERKLKAFIGPPLESHLVRAYGFSEQQAAKAYSIFKEYYLDKGIHENSLYPGITQAIKCISGSGKKVYIATSKPEPQAMTVLEKFAIAGLFTDVFAARKELGIRSKAEVLTHAVTSLGEVRDAVMVGDRIYDIQGGKHVGFDTVGVLYGYGDIEELKAAGSDYLVDSTDDLAILLGGS